MSIVRRNMILEEYFTKFTSNWHPLSDTEYRNLIENWRSKFEEKLKVRDMQTGDKGFIKLREKLPFGGFVFNCPNYRYLKNNRGSDRQSTFAYSIEEIIEIERMTMNSSGAIICNDWFEYMCAFNFDAPGGIPEIFVEI